MSLCGVVDTSMPVHVVCLRRAPQRGGVVGAMTRLFRHISGVDIWCWLYWYSCKAVLTMAYYLLIALLLFFCCFLNAFLIIYLSRFYCSFVAFLLSSELFTYGASIVLLVDQLQCQINDNLDSNPYSIAHLTIEWILKYVKTLNLRYPINQHTARVIWREGPSSFLVGRWQAQWLEDIATSS